MSEQSYRIEHDSLGEIKVPANALYAAQTQRAVENFPISDLRFPRMFIRALGMIKGAAAAVNLDLGLMEAQMAAAIQKAAQEVADGQYDADFPLDIFQTGSGTSTNMNANEVLATLASRHLGANVHPNDHINMSQSSNDVIPTAIHVSGYLAVTDELLPALDHLHQTLLAKAAQVDNVVTTGRTHLMDAMPVRLSQELGGWASQITHGMERIRASLPRLAELAQGGTAVGTGINAHPEFGARIAQK
ncbi:MAG: aspartate ammonia-lyase, partial [Caldilineaceae bacterium]|nr:aspartate ammonia-lyase [Caldilineaceae bacterium]